MRDTACSSATLLYFYRNSVPTSILARYQACQVTYQLEISSLNFQLVDQSESYIRNPIAPLAPHLQIVGGNFKADRSRDNFGNLQAF